MRLKLLPGSANFIVVPSSSNADAGHRHQMVNKWNDIIESSKTGYSALIDVNMWLGRATLDAYVLASVGCTQAMD